MNAHTESFQSSTAQRNKSTNTDPDTDTGRQDAAPGQRQPPHAPLLTYLSLGWGIQSWTIAAMIALGELPPIDLAIHSDTTHEAEETYRHASKWTPWLEARGLKVVTVTPAAALTDLTTLNRSGVFIPALTVNRETAELGRLSRQCTDRWKIRPIRQHLRTLLPPRPKPEAVHAIMGISFDEWHRMRSSDVRYILNIYPLVDSRLTRADCITWLRSRDLDVPPKSACVFCPYHSQAAWRDLKAQGGPDWDKAVMIDNAIRRGRPNHDLYIHQKPLPIEQAVVIPQDQGAEQLEMDIPCHGGTCFV